MSGTLLDDSLSLITKYWVKPIVLFCNQFNRLTNFYDILIIIIKS